ncbi:MAG: metallophosphoesterase family protein [Candidatus Cloacimonetes bacterium]|nr:metallophosphoesterase family protein [Candidatus Cloacimonadota bacterium]
MKKIIVLSDTHKNQKILRDVFKNENEYTHIIHLGDDFEDLNNNFDITDNKELIRVPGLYHPGYKDGTIPAILEIEIEHWNFALAHRLEDLSKSTKPADIYLYGHTHHSNYDHIEDKHFINPGHLKADVDRGHKASYLVMTICNSSVDIHFKHLDGKIFRHKHIKKL